MNRAFYLLKAHARDERGVTAIEFALVMPVALVLIMGLGELCYRSYVQSVVFGAVQEAGRASSVEGGAQSSAAIDLLVKNEVTQVAPQAKMTFSRTSYSDFSGVKQPEPFTDTNKNGIYDNTECFQDLNNNQRWDADRGVANSQGGASDVTMYTVTTTFPNLFPASSLLGWNSKQEISATTTLQNQPYGLQAIRSPQTVCPKP